MPGSGLRGVCRRWTVLPTAAESDATPLLKGPACRLEQPRAAAARRAAWRACPTSAQVYFTHSYVAPVVDADGGGHDVRRRRSPRPSSAATSPACSSIPRSPATSGLRILRNWLRCSLSASSRASTCATARSSRASTSRGCATPAIPAALAARYNREGIDEIVILDVTATLEARQARAQTIRAVAREIFLPLCVGGGIRGEDGCGGGDRGGRRQGQPQHGGARRPRRSSRTLAAPLRQPGGRSSPSTPNDAATASPLRAQRHRRDAARCGRMGARGGRSRRRRDPADLDRSRWDQVRVRLRADRRGVRLPCRFRSSPQAARARSSTSPRCSPPAAPTPRSPRRFFISTRRASADLETLFLAAERAHIPVRALGVKIARTLPNLCDLALTLHHTC